MNTSLVICIDMYVHYCTIPQSAIAWHGSYLLGFAAGGSSADPEKHGGCEMRAVH